MQNRYRTGQIGVPTPLAWSVCVLGVCLALSPAAADAVDDVQGEHVRLVIDFGDGVEKHFTRLEWKDKMTVFDAMQLARQHRRGIRFEYRGKGATLLLTQIDDVKNQGAGGKNWIYRVNEKVGNRSIAIYPLKSGDTILWKFETYRYNR